MVKVNNAEPYLVAAHLAWMDAIERLDTIILEIRHLQTNIIHYLREPTLLQPLVYEDCYLWGGSTTKIERKASQDSKKTRADWFKIFEKMHNKTDINIELKRLSAVWIIQYPSFETLPKIDNKNDSISQSPTGTNTDFYDRDTRLIINNRLENNIFFLGDNSTDFTDETRRHYHSLCVLQIIKANVLLDKLMLCYRGWRAISPRRQRDPQDLAQFLLIRNLVIHNAREHIGHLGDLQSSFDSALDIGHQDDPLPSTSRRREQGVYSPHLSDLSLSFRELADDLLSHFGCPNYCDRSDGATGPLLIHHWDHTSASRASRVWDDVNRSQSPDSERNQPRDVHFISTSYWLPERPDLQALIAHEAAHLSIYDRLADMDSVMLDQADDPFTDLLKDIQYAINSFIGGENFSGFGVTSSLHREIAADLVAATLRRDAYLTALFLEAFGYQLEGLFETPGRRYDPALVDCLETVQINHVFRSLLPWQWYLRLIVVVKWLELVDDQSHDVSGTLRQGIRALCEKLLDHLGTLWKTAKKDDVGRYIYMLGQRLEQILEDSSAVDTAKSWRRSIRHHPIKDNQALRCPLSEKELDEETRIFLIEMLVQLKTRPDRPLYPMKEDENKYVSDREDYQAYDFVMAFCEQYSSNYGGFIHRSNKNRKNVFEILDMKLGIFKYAFDVPWECAVIGAMDFFVKPIIRVAGAGGNEYKSLSENSDNWMVAMHYASAMGRELYQYALEFFIWQSRSPEDRLPVARRIIEANAKLFEDCLKLIDKQPSCLPSGDPDFTKFKFIRLALLKDPQNIIDKKDKLTLAGEKFIEMLRKAGATNTASSVDIELTLLVEIINLVGIDAYALNPRAFYRGWHSRLDQLAARGVLRRICGLALQHLMIELCYFIQALENLSSGVTKIDSQDSLSCINLQKTVFELIRFLLVRSVSRDHQIISNDIDRKLQSYFSKDINILIRSIIKDLDTEFSLNILTNSFDLGLAELEENDEVDNGRRRKAGVKWSLPSPYLYLFGRQSLAQANSGISNNSELHRIVSFLTNREASWTGFRVEDRTEHPLPLDPIHFSTLGRFDIMYFKPERPMSRHGVISYNEKTDTSGVEPAYAAFVRREFAIPFRFHRPDVNKSNSGQNSSPHTFQRASGRSEKWPLQINSEGKFDRKIIGFISVLLGQRISRLSFVTRLLHAVKTAQKVNNSKGLQLDMTLADVGGAIDPATDAGLLGEGWGDVLLVIAVDKNAEITKDDVIRLFNIQNGLFNDFHVDRTEIALSTATLPVALKNLDIFDVNCAFRLVEDRSISLNYAQFVDIAKKHKDYLDILITPGLMDVVVRPKVIKCKDETKGSEGQLMDLLRELSTQTPPLIARLSTTISPKVTNTSDRV